MARDQMARTGQTQWRQVCGNHQVRRLNSQVSDRHLSHCAEDARRRELSEAQLRQRLAPPQHDPDAIDAAITRLKSERSLDDARVAGAIARSETASSERGRLRVTGRSKRPASHVASPKRVVDEVVR